MLRCAQPCRIQRRRRLLRVTDGVAVLAARRTVQAGQVLPDHRGQRLAVDDLTLAQVRGHQRQVQQRVPRPQQRHRRVSIGTGAELVEVRLSCLGHARADPCNGSPAGPSGPRGARTRRGRVRAFLRRDPCRCLLHSPSGRGPSPPASSAYPAANSKRRHRHSGGERSRPVEDEPTAGGLRAAPPASPRRGGQTAPRAPGGTPASRQALVRPSCTSRTRRSWSCDDTI